MGQIFLVRHGQASFGTDDYDRLSGLGHEQSRLLGAWFAECGQGFDLAVTGSLKRHNQTAQACLDALPDELKPSRQWHVEPRLNEYDQNEIVARHRPDLAEPGAMQDFLRAADNPRRAFQQVFSEAMDRWMAGAHDGDYSESWSEFRARCIAALEAVAEAGRDSRRVVVFTSGGPIAALGQHLLGLSDQSTFELNWSLVNSAVTKLLFQPGRISLSTLNAHAHLERTSNPQHITYR